MGEQTVYVRKKIHKTPYVLFYTYLLVVLMLLLSVASYTWYSLSRTPKVNNMNVYITSGDQLELSTDPGAETWTNQLDIYSTKELSAYQGENAEKPALLQTTWSDIDGCFYGPMYGYDGRLMKVMSWFPLSDERNANNLTADSYYIKATLYARCGMPVEVSLAEAMDVDSTGTQGSGTYVIGSPNTGKGPETAVRIGFRITYVDSAGNELSERGPMIIYEPNIDRHVDGSTDYIPTYSIHDLDSQLVDEDRLIMQAFSKSTSKTGDFLTDTALFTLKPGEIAKIEVYIWLEGQDVDCSNSMSDGISTTAIQANIQFTGSTESQSEMVPIE